MLGEQVGVQEGQLDGVADLLDLVAEAADVLVGDVGHLFQDELLDLRLGQVLEHEPGADVQQQRVAGPQGAVAQRLADLHHPLLVGVADDQGPVQPEHLLELDDLALDLVGAGLDHVEGLVEHQLLAGLERLGVDVGVDVDPQLAPARGQVDGAVLVDAQEHPEAGGRGGELLDLFLEGDDLLPGLPEGGGQALVLGQGLGELALGLEQALLEHPDLPGRVLEAAAEQGRLLLEELDLALQLGRFRGLLGVGVGVATGPRLPGAVGVLHVSPPFGGCGGYRWMAR